MISEPRSELGQLQPVPLHPRGLLAEYIPVDLPIGSDRLVRFWNAIIVSFLEPLRPDQPYVMSLAGGYCSNHHPLVEKVGLENEPQFLISYPSSTERKPSWLRFMGDRLKDGTTILIAEVMCSPRLEPVAHTDLLDLGASMLQAAVQGTDQSGQTWDNQQIRTMLSGRGSSKLWDVSYDALGQPSAISRTST